MRLIKKLIPSTRAIGQCIVRASFIAMVTILGAMVTILGAYIGLSIGTTFDSYLLSQKNYKLTMLTKVGPYVLPAGQIAVTDVSHERDGSVCFKTLDTNQRGCVKLDLYDLTEAEIQ